MYVESEPVTRSVHVIGSKGFAFDDLVDVALQDFEGDHSFTQDAKCRRMNLWERGSGPGGFDRVLLCSEYDLIEITSSRFKLSAHRVSSRYVRRVPF